jgi:hypothetical protein
VTTSTTEPVRVLIRLVLVQRLSELRAQRILDIAADEDHSITSCPRISLDITIAEQDQPCESNRLYFVWTTVMYSSSLRVAKRAVSSGEEQGYLPGYHEALGQKHTWARPWSQVLVGKAGPEDDHTVSVDGLPPFHGSAGVSTMVKKVKGKVVVKKVKRKAVVREVLEAAGSTSRAPLKSETRTPVEVSSISEAVGRERGCSRLRARSIPPTSARTKRPEVDGG